jgi:tellurite resistance protein
MDPSDPLGINKYSEMMRQSQEPLVEALRQLNGITQRVQIESPLSKLVIESVSAAATRVSTADGHHKAAERRGFGAFVVWL